MDHFSKKEMRDIDQLYNHLVEYEKTQNIVDVNEFIQFIPLFRKDSQLFPQDVITSLSTKFFGRFNLYKPISVVENGKEIFRVPQLFVEINDVDNKHINIVNNFRTNGTSDIPRYAQEATYGLLAAILKSQEDVSDKGFESYGEYIKHLSEEYGKDTERFINIKTGKDNAQLDEAETSTNFDDIDGIVWK